MQRILVLDVQDGLCTEFCLHAGIQTQHMDQVHLPNRAREWFFSSFRGRHGVSLMNIDAEIGGLLGIFQYNQGWDSVENTFLGVDGK